MSRVPLCHGEKALVAGRRAIQRDRDECAAMAAPSHCAHLGKATKVGHDRFVNSPQSQLNWRALLGGAGACVGGVFALKYFPEIELEVFARGAARLVSGLTGTPVFRSDAGWIVPLAHAPITITTKCSAADFFVMVAGVIGFQLARRLTRPLPAMAVGLTAALPVTIFVNALRVVTVAHAHPWFISRLPAAYEPLLHMLVGAAVFLPSLILLNLSLETYGRSRSRSLAKV